MRISEHFNLNKYQPELDFVDIDFENDIPLFLDPFFLSLRNDQWSNEATRTVKNFFQTVISLIREENLESAKRLFIHLHEPNSTCLGLSKGSPRGRGVGKGNTNSIFESIIQSRAIQTGLIQDLEDNLLFVEGFGKDKLSDMTTNIIRNQLIVYTQDQCKLHEIPLRPSVSTGFYWNRRTGQWEASYQDMLVINNRQILLAPKGVVSYCTDYTPEKYYSNFVIDFIQHEHIDLNSIFVKERNNGDRYISKKIVKELNPYSKQFLREFTLHHPDILNEFKRRTWIHSLNDFDSGGLILDDVVSFQMQNLRSIPTGSENATQYHRLIIGILEIIFYPHLIYPILEREIHQGRKRIDITFDNAAETGIFHRLSNTLRIPSQYVMIECKNYSADPANPALDQLSGRFSLNRGKFGILSCRYFENFQLFMQRCRDTYQDDRGLIIPLVDEDLMTILENIRNQNFGFIDAFLSERIRSIALN